LWGRENNSDGLLLGQIDHRQLSLLSGEMLICAGCKALIVAVEMVNYCGIFEKELDRARTANEADHEYQQRYRAPLHRAAVRLCFSALDAVLGAISGGKLAPQPGTSWRILASMSNVAPGTRRSRKSSLFP
jgi:hypothetical protein